MQVDRGCAPAPSTHLMGTTERELRKEMPIKTCALAKALAPQYINN